jgi:prepilin-type N-terminal cleavage/methylation domain-containing protein
MTIIMEANKSDRLAIKSTDGRATGGFTLMELLVALGLSGILLTAILTTFVFIVKGGTRLMHYRDIESRASLALQQFAIDTRQAGSVNWVSANVLRMEVGDSGAVSYTYDPAKGTLSRQTTAGTRTLASDINTFTFDAFDRDGTELDLAAANINTRTKMVQIQIGFRSRSRTVAPVESDIISARYMLRNKTSS